MAAGHLQRLDELIAFDQLFRERRTNASLAARAMQKSESEARQTLERLVEWGLAEGRGERRSRVYLLSAVVYRVLGEAAAYVRTRGFHRIQQEAMIIEYVKAHGKIQRADIVELCALTQDEARVVLRGMLSRALLQQEGVRRGTFYVLGPSAPRDD